MTCGTTIPAARPRCSTCVFGANGQGCGRSEQERLPVYFEPGDGPARSSDQGNAGADARPRSPASSPGRRSRFRSRRMDKPMSPVSPVFPWISRRNTWRHESCSTFHAVGCESDLRARDGRRRELRSDLVQPADRLALRQRHRQSDKCSPSRKGLLLRFRSGHGRTRVATGLRRLRAGGIGRHSERSCIRRDGSNIAGYFFAYDAKTGEAAVEVQHRRRGIRLPCDVYGER